MTSACMKDIKKVRIGFQKLENSDGSSITSENSEEMLSIHFDQLTPALVEEAKTQLNETEESRKKCLAELRKFIENDKKLSTKTDDLFLLAFLRARKFNVKRAFKLLQNYWSFRKQHRDIYDYPSVVEVKELILHSYMGLLLHRDRKGCAVFVFKAGFWDPEKDTYEALFRAITGVLVYCLGHPATQIAGFRIIIDARGLSWKQLKHFTPANIMLMVRSTQFCFPARYKGIHVVSENKMISFLWSMVYPFLTAKLKKRVLFHGEDLSPIREYIHPSVLPVDFGGLGPCFDNSSWAEILDKEELNMKIMLEYGYRD